MFLRLGRFRDWTGAIFRCVRQLFSYLWDGRDVHWVGYGRDLEYLLLGGEGFEKEVVVLG